LTTRLAVIVATFGYVGFCPIAPGTAGSAAGLLLYALVRHVGLGVPEAAAIVLVSAAGVLSGATAERHFRCIDPGPVVIDEVAGMLITLFLVPVGWTGALAGFVLFRFFDIVKPYPAARLERLPGGLGMVADDAMAGVYANIALRLLWRFLPGWVL
jgi:phosphatidylglycerophosphatase A